MRIAPVLLYALVVTGCSINTGNDDSQPETAKPPQVHHAANFGPTGAEAVRQLKAWYENTSADCGGPDKPAHLCSGILLRATDTNPAFYPWDPSPGAIRLGGVSFSWLRRDQTFSRTWENWNGFVFYPNQAIPDGKIKTIKVLCTFPINANTWERPTLQGCGAMPDEPDTDTCQSLGIDSASHWLEKYGRTATLSKVCGWDVRDGSGDTAAWFKMSLDAHQGLTGLARETFNELMLSTWNTGEGADLPLHSFFYPARSLESRAKARVDQARYREAYKITLPLIRMAFPVLAQDTTVISFLESDQADSVALPVHVDFEDLPTGSPLDVVSGGYGFETSVSKRVEISNADQGIPHLSGNYLLLDNLVRFPIDAVVDAKEARKVEFSWACNSYCVVLEERSGRETVLVKDEHIGPMQSGRLTLEVEAPETLRLMSSMEDGALMALDNLSIQ
ncbi:conserved protein of unknown function [Pseudomonas sp. JV551A1]|uniref:Lipoprotein n=1 Tax=Pseudomonas inefficax TaxID=2078786 RepID=A0AAQ1P740_9PSED|nr:hypothetical protein [Pseudomonas]SPO55067.1 conserved protein of unknown function [Pseudomonas sp. JV551A1]SPO60997.1 conserved protein of unknown function [Pseudomonas inefficax]